MNAKLLIRKVGSQLLYRTKLLDLTSRVGLPWRVLMYHRITSPAEEGYPLQPGMYVTKQSFAQHLDYLATHCNVIELDTLVAMLLNKQQIPPRTVALSFDDGWLDNYVNAFPLLKARGLPATIFLATDYIGSNKTLWSDAVPYAVAKFRATTFDQARITALAEINEVPTPLLTAYLTCLQCDEAQLEHSLEVLILGLKDLERDIREGFAAALLSEAGGKPRPSFMNWDQVREMSSHQISFGSHTHRHLPLNELDSEAIKQELADSRESLLANEANLAGCFCYPEGRYSATSQQVLAAVGIGASLATTVTSDWAEQPPLIGRIGVHNDITSTTASFATRLWCIIS